LKKETMQLKTLIRRPIHLVLLTVFILGLIRSNAQMDTVNLQRRDVNLMIDNLEMQTKLNGNLKNGFDTVRQLYNQTVDSLNKYIGYLQDCMRQRDTAIKYIDLLRTNLSRAWTAKDIAEAKATAERNKKAKSWGVGLSGGYNPFTRLPYAGIGINFSIVRFSLRGLFKESGGASVPTTSGSMIDRMRSGY
jgi:hypothetical protein